MLKVCSFANLEKLVIFCIDHLSPAEILDSKMKVYLDEKKDKLDRHSVCKWQVSLTSPYNTQTGQQLPLHIGDFNAFSINFKLSRILFQRSLSKFNDESSVSIHKRQLAVDVVGASAVQPHVIQIQPDETCGGAGEKLFLSLISFKYLGCVSSW